MHQTATLEAWDWNKYTSHVTRANPYEPKIMFPTDTLYKH